eukprot:scaffold88217_cov24-Attheya_sp.AAC.1
MHQGATTAHIRFRACGAQITFSERSELVHTKHGGRPQVTQDTQIPKGKKERTRQWERTSVPLLLI